MQGGESEKQGQAAWRGEKHTASMAQSRELRGNGLLVLTLVEPTLVSSGFPGALGVGTCILKVDTFSDCG